MELTREEYEKLQERKERALAELRECGRLFSEFQDLPGYFARPGEHACPIDQLDDRYLTEALHSATMELSKAPTVENRKRVVFIMDELMRRHKPMTASEVIDRNSPENVRSNLIPDGGMEITAESVGKGFESLVRGESGS